jgi:hypothetical protein
MYELTQDVLRESLQYDQATGEFVWLKANPRAHINAGRVAGFRTPRGYVQIMLWSKRYYAHRLAWLYMTGRWPSKLVDHINGCRDDNRWANLREATYRVNQENKRRANKNNLSGLLGVITHSPIRFSARIKAAGKNIHLGSFSSAHEAHAAYVAAKRRLHEGNTL